MDLLNNLAVGFATALSLQNLLYCFLGVTLGTLIGVLPGLGPVATLAMLLPITYTLDPTSALIMLAGIYYGSQYGGSTTAILVNLPGESASVVTCLDGYQMARHGKAGTALGIAAIGSFIAGCFATILVAAFAPPLIELAFKFGPAEYFSLMVLGLVGAVVLANGSVLKAFAMIILGLLLGIIGADVNSGTFRFDFGIAELQDGIDFVAISMGLFGFTEIIVNLSKGETRDSITEKVGSIWPSRKELCKAAPAITRGTLLGSFLGILPGGGALLASFASYTLEKKVGGKNANPPFGKGNIAGVAGPESANNAGAQTSFIPMLTLGIPCNATMALMIGALMIHNITPGPQVMSSNPTLFWGYMKVYSHTADHQPVVAGEEEAFLDSMRRIEETLTENLGTKHVKAMAYPNGRYTEAAQRLLDADGYVLQFTVENSVITRKTKRDAIPRITIESGMSGEDVVRKIELTAENTFAAEGEGNET